MGDGLLNVFLPHATAGDAVFELGAGTEPDLAETLERLLPLKRYLAREIYQRVMADHRGHAAPQPAA